MNKKDNYINFYKNIIFRSYKNILEMPANELVSTLEIPALFIRRIPNPEYGGAITSYNANGEKGITNRNISTCLNLLGNPKEYLLVGNTLVTKDGKDFKATPEPTYAAFSNERLLEDEVDVLKFANACYKDLRTEKVTKEQVEAYLGKPNKERMNKLKNMLN